MGLLNTNKGKIMGLNSLSFVGVKKAKIIHPLTIRLRGSIESRRERGGWLWERG